MLARLESGSLGRVVFAVPSEVRWALPLYELALMTAHTLRDAAAAPELVFVTPERRPMNEFGPAASDHIADLVREQGIELITDRAPAAVEGDELRCEDGTTVAAPFVVTLPALAVPDIPGLPQGRSGFIACDPEMRVDGLRNVWAAGDATWLPIKQGGLAAQQAEVAAGSILAEAGLGPPPAPFSPIVRAALLTGEEPRFLRARPARRRASAPVRSGGRR